MKRKPAAPVETPVVDSEILEKAKAALKSDNLRPLRKCEVCQSETVAPNSTENLCWVCRRLKISAWKESDQQISAQE
jgi:hypothetical protein